MLHCCYNRVKEGKMEVVPPKCKYMSLTVFICTSAVIILNLCIVVWKSHIT